MNKKGFTLIELLVVIGIIAILAAVVIVALNPARQFAQARNTQRQSNVNTILNAIHQYAVDNRGTLPSAVTSLDVGSTTPVCQNAAASCTSFLDLSVLVPTYVVAIPGDPQIAATTSDPASSGYAVWRTSGNRVGVTALNAELDEEITVER